jgi:hypothetical protein
MKNFKTEFQMIEYMIEKLQFEPNITLVVSKEYLNCILDSIDFDCKTFTKEVDSEYYTYSIEKYEDLQGNIHIEVIPVEFDDNGLVSTEIDNEYVIVQENVLDEDDIDQIYADEELIVVNYEYEMGVDFSNNGDNSCECCHENCDDELTEEEDILEEYALLIENTDGCPNCIRRILSELIEEIQESNKENVTMINLEMPKFDSNIEEFIKELSKIKNFSLR